MQCLALQYMKMNQYIKIIIKVFLIYIYPFHIAYIIILFLTTGLPTFIRYFYQLDSEFMVYFHTLYMHI